MARRLRGRSDPSFAQRVHEYPHEERRPSRCAQAGIDEDRIRSPTEPRLQELGNGGSRQRRETDHFSGGIRRHRRKQLGIGACLARAGRQDERGVQLFEAREQEGQVTQGRGVCPVGVVDDQTEWTDGGQIRAQPVEAVENRERGIDARRRRAVRSGCAWKSEQPGRHSGRGLQQIGTLELRCLGQRRLEELTHHSESEIALELRPPRPKHAHSRVCCRGPRRGKQRGLTNPSRPFDHQERAPSRASLGQRRLDPRQLLIPLEQRFGGRGHFHVPQAYSPYAESHGCRHGAIASS